MVPKTVGLIVFEQMAATDLTGPAEAFSRAKIQNGDGSESHCYHVLTLGINAGSFTTECGIVIKPQLVMADAPPLDTLIVPGGNGIPNASNRIAKWLRRKASAARRIVSLGSGIYALAATGLLDRRHVTTHWHVVKDVTLRFPKVQVVPNSLFVKDDRFYTCAGGTSAVDLALSLIEEDCGRQVALKVARELVVHLKRSGEQQQYSEALRFQVQSSDRFVDLPAWILCNLNQDLTVESLAQKACMSPRNFSRLFKAAFGETPADFVARARITEARERLLIPRTSIENVATFVGFKSVDAFSRTFERVVGTRPSTYRG